MSETHSWKIQHHASPCNLLDVWLSDVYFCISTFGFACIYFTCGFRGSLTNGLMYYLLSMTWICLYKESITGKNVIAY